MGDIVERLLGCVPDVLAGEDLGYAATAMKEAAAGIVTLRDRAESAERARDEALRRVTVTDEMVERAICAWYRRPDWIVMHGADDREQFAQDVRAEMRAAITAALSPSPVST